MYAFSPIKRDFDNRHGHFENQGGWGETWSKWLSKQGILKHKGVHPNFSPKYNTQNGSKKLKQRQHGMNVNSMEEILKDRAARNAASFLALRAIISRLSW